MKKIIWLGIAMFATVVVNVQAKELTKKDVEEIVHNYIVNNGGVIASSVDSFLADQRKQAAANLISEHTPTFGNKNAKVKFIEFGDFRCGYCKRVQKTVDELTKKYSDKVLFAFKNMPILSAESHQAALASLAAHKQGKAWEFNEKLWDNQPRLGDKLFVEIAKEIGLDIDKFNKDRASKEIESQVQQDLKDGQAAGVNGTPHFVIGGKAVSGAQPMKAFVDAIESALSAESKNEEK